MKRFSFISETDARVLEPGSTVELEAGGHVTPLARDTLRDRRVTVVYLDGRDVATAGSLVPVARIRTVAVGADHGGLALKQALVAHLRARGVAVIDLGTHTPAPVDYPDVAAAVARAVASKEADAGLVVDGAGIGSAIAANKVPGVRAAMCTTPTIARYSREHNGANVITLGASLVSLDEATAILEAWLATPMTEPRYIKRLAKIAAIESQGQR